jgi:geranyl-CoA carboxylase alpha subunit
MGAVTLRRVLVANRGEIACRIIRGVQSLGRQAVAVYSEADAASPHVALADAAECIGPPPAAQSYLDIAAILAAAKAAGADAVHPGYGFLAENAEFADACRRAGLTFIGPPAAAIELMGNKAAAKRRMNEAGVPCVPGYEGEDQSDGALLAAAESIGYPVMVKAAAGGGGRGMRLVARAADLADALRAARSEAENAFGSGELILEKAIQRPRHVEIQVFADDHGGVIHLGERDCSVQRRHQKVIEESPCPVLTDALRAAMGEAAVEAARSIDYRGAGTVEFLLDEAGRFFFLEMNTRLQVEHPVTEMVTGLDLVALQIAVAEGRPLGVAQAGVALRGHAIEARLYAEDPRQAFLPSTGRIARWQPPSGEGIRVDAGVASGSDISPFYDPMVAKVIAWAETRDAARLRLVAALERTVLFGVANNRDFLIDVLRRDRFAAGDVTTAFIDEEYGGEAGFNPPAATSDAAIAAVLQYRLAGDAALDASVAVAPALRDWSSAGALTTHYRYDVGGEPVALTVSPDGRGHYRVRGGESAWRVGLASRGECEARITVEDHAVDVRFHAAGPAMLYASIDGRSHLFVNQRALPPRAEEAGGGGRVVAAMHGQLIELAVAPGDAVRKGARLLVLEAMKMQHEMRAEIDGVVAAVHVDAGQQIAADTLIMEIEAHGETGDA